MCVKKVPPQRSGQYPQLGPNFLFFLAPRSISDSQTIAAKLIHPRQYGCTCSQYPPITDQQPVTKNQMRRRVGNDNAMYRVCEQYTVDLQWNRVSNLEPSSPKAETLLLGHSGPKLALTSD
ncbi:hypothetical protein AVEN_35408-1 [Araneus ventricosus]|uniref:Uncharacterized protein n=1 Tax=Araneus ventricosus TaxID=182803 RepID=A0A4Y2N8Z7_ARAVE|nr:hypothetical protein AVEN_35408-1 [Araneus ventricosus]